MVDQLLCNEKTGVRFPVPAPDNMFHGLGVAEAEMVDAPACDAGDGGFEPRRSPLSRGTFARSTNWQVARL